LVARDRWARKEKYKNLSLAAKTSFLKGNERQERTEWAPHSGYMELAVFFKAVSF